MWLLVLLAAIVAGLWLTCSRSQVTPVATTSQAAPTSALVPAVPAEATAPSIDPGTLQRAAISGLVRDEHGRAIAGARVCALPSSPLLDARHTLTPPCALSERDGHYRIDDIWPVPHSVTASAPGHIPAFYVRGDHVAQMEPVVVTPGAELAGIDVTLPGGGVEIHGTVKDLSGGAVEGAIVTSGGLFYGTGMAVTTSGPEGAFTLWVGPGAPNVWARAEGYAGGSEAGAAPGHMFELFLTPEAVLVGKVVRVGTGAPVAGASVTAQRGDTNGGGLGVAITDADGNFRLPRLNPGAYKPSVEADDAYGVAREQVVLGLGETSAPIVIEAHPAALVEGTVVVTGGSFCPRGSVSLHDAASGRERGAEIEADGLARARGLLPGSYSVTVYCAGFISAETYAPVIVADKPVLGLRWDVSAGRKILGVVVTARGEPVPAISVVARGKVDPSRPDAPVPQNVVVDTDLRGRFELAGLRPGPYELRAFVKMNNARATPSQPIEVTLPEGQDLTDIRFSLPAAGQVRGEVRDVHGHPVARARVSLQGPGRGPTVMTGDDGSFHAREAAAGEYRVTATRDGVKLRAPGTGDDDVQGIKVTVVADAVASVKLVVETGGGQLVGVVRDSGGGPVSDAFIEVSRESESAVGPGSASRQWSPVQRPHLTDADGRFTVDELFPGRYTVRALRRGGGEATREHVALGTDLTLTIAETGRLAGVVTLAGRAAPEELTVILEDPGTGYRRTDQFFRTGGAWGFAELPPGAYKLQLNAPEGDATTELALGPGEEKSGVRIDLVGRVKLRGTVVDLDGAPVPGVTIQVNTEASFVWTDRAEPTTDAAGRFEVPAVPVGDVKILAFARGVADFSQATISTRISATTGGLEVELPPIRVARQRVKPGETTGDLGYAIKLAGPGEDPAASPPTVALVRPMGPASATGLLPGDVVLTVDGHDVAGAQRHLYPPLTRVPVGTLVRLGLARGVTVEITAAAPL